MKKSKALEYEDFADDNELPELEQNLVAKAYSIANDAYAPYSNFKVGAAVLLGNGEVVLGSNQENIAYPSGLCAERVALFYTGANFPNETIKLLVIVAKGDLLPFDKILSPCGSCRQVLVESQSRQKEPFQVILVSQNRRTIRFSSAKDLLPFAFGTI